MGTGQKDLGFGDLAGDGALIPSIGQQGNKNEGKEDGTHVVGDLVKVASCPTTMPQYTQDAFAFDLLRTQEWAIPFETAQVEEL